MNGGSALDMVTVAAVRGDAVSANLAAGVTNEDARWIIAKAAMVRERERTEKTVDAAGMCGDAVLEPGQAFGSILGLAIEALRRP